MKIAICKKHKAQLIEYVDGIPLGFMACPVCKTIPDEIIVIDEAEHNREGGKNAA